MPTFATPQSRIEALYVAYTGHAGDAAGVSYWADRMTSGGMTMAQVSASFAVQSSIKAGLPYLSAPDSANPSTFIDSLYQNMFGHAPDAAGKAYWAARLDTGAHTAAAIGQTVVDIISGATGRDGGTLSAAVEQHQQLKGSGDNEFTVSGPTGIPGYPDVYLPFGSVEHTVVSTYLIAQAASSGTIMGGLVAGAAALFLKQDLPHAYDSVIMTVNQPAYLLISAPGIDGRIDSGIPLWTKHLSLQGAGPTTFYAYAPADYSELQTIDSSASTGGITFTGGLQSTLLSLPFWPQAMQVGG